MNMETNLFNRTAECDETNTQCLKYRIDKINFNSFNFCLVVKAK